MTIARAETDRNPFSTVSVRPGALPYQFTKDASAKCLLDRLAGQSWRGQIIGPQGSGKSTLLHSLVPIMRALYRASQAGVAIDLIVRGFCCLRPGIPGRSENIRVVSVIGRFLEHSRIFYFASGNEDPFDGDYFIGSADWMHRNLEERVEAVTPVEDRQHRERLWEIFHASLDDQRQAWEMQPDGTYIQRKPNDQTPREAAMGTQELLMERTLKAGKSAT